MPLAWLADRRRVDILLMTDLTEQLSKDQELRRDQIAIDLEAVLRIPHGRRTLLWFLEQCGLYRTAYTSEDAATNFRLGEQSVGLRLIAKLEEIGPTEYPLLLLEAAQRKDQNKETVHVVDTEQD